MLAHGLPSSFFSTSVPAVAVYGIFAPFTVISCFVREDVSAAGGAAVGVSGFAAGGGVCAARNVTEAKIKTMDVFICRCSDYASFTLDAGIGRYEPRLSNSEQTRLAAACTLERDH